jgi:hypothetical protein
LLRYNSDMLPTGKNAFIPFLLFCVLLTLLVLKVSSSFYPRLLPSGKAPTNIYAPTAEELNIDPTTIRVIAQANPNPTSILANATAVQSSCLPAGPEQTPPPATTLAACQESSVNLVDYVVPPNPVCDDGSPVTEANKGDCVTSSSVTLTDTYIGSVNNSVQALRDGFVKQNSNEIHFIWKHDRSRRTIGLAQDTIWGGGPAGGFFVCDGTSEQAFYRVYDGETNELGASTYPETVQCDQENSHSGYLRSFRKEWNGQNINTVADSLIPDSQLSECNVNGQSKITVTNSNKMIYSGKAKCNGSDVDVAVMLATGGAGAEEVNVYCKNKGLCAWYQKLDFTVEKNQPQYWKKQADAGTPFDVCALADAGGSRSTLPNYFEYNIQRECGKSATKVMNNFLDEYSVSCVPKADYILEWIRRDECWKTSKGCSDWNTTGELKFVAGTKLFGLFRNEDAIEKRYNSNTNSNKSRQESIEAYLTGRPDRLPAAVQSSNRSGLNISSGSIDVGSLGLFQSPLHKLSTLDQQCVMIFDKLKAVKELCDPINRIEGEENSECAINQYLPNSSFRYADLYSQLVSYAQTYGYDTTNPAPMCARLMAPNKNNESGSALREQILKVDPAMEVGYRPAFVVLATMVGDPTMINPKFRSKTEDKSKFWQVDYLEVRVPTFGSDFLYTPTGTPLNDTRPGGTYQDPLRVTANILTTPETQKLYREEEAEERGKVTAAAKSIWPGISGPVPVGNAIGAADAPIKCQSKSDPKVFGEEHCDNIARALISFINARAAVVPGDELHRKYSPVRGWVPSPNNTCTVSEPSLYGNSVLNQRPYVDEQYHVAQESKTLGSKLESKERVGAYEKKLEASNLFEANIPDALTMSQNAPVLGTTRMFYVSPHNFTMLYAQNAFLGMMTPEQQEKFLKDGNYNTAMKTTGLDNLDVQKDASFYRVEKPGTNPPEFDLVEVSVKMVRPPAYQDKKQESPLMWQTGGSIASFPTRMLALMTTPPGSKVHNFTLGCTGANATEMWLKGECIPVDGPGPSGNDATGSGKPPEPSKQCINVWTEDAAMAGQYKADILAKLPFQQKRVDKPEFKFAGWAAYFGVSGRQDDQHLFRNDCNGGQSCIQYILDEATSKTDLNPYLVAAIALNETGGLISSEPQFIGPHFGCGVDRSRPGFISQGTIEEKLNCMLGFFAENRGLSSDAALRKYGYSNGARNDNLNKIISYISENGYEGTCEP